MTLDDLFENIRRVENKELGAGALAEEIGEAEARLAVKFPSAYRTFLDRCGWARIGYDELYGLGRDVPLHLNLLRNTFAERNEMQPSLPPSLVPIMNDGAGNHYCLDLSRDSNTDCPIIFWDHELEDRQCPERVASSFVDWLGERVERCR